MILTAIGSILLLISVILFTKTSKGKDEIIERQRQATEKLVEARQLEVKNVEEQKQLDQAVKILSEQKANLIRELAENEEKINNIYLQKEEDINKRVELFKEKSTHAAEVYFDNIEEIYQKKEHEYAMKMDDLQLHYREAAAALEKIKKTRKATQEAILKEKEVQAKKDDYRLLPSHLELEDIKRLDIVKNELHKPRILSMLVWQTYWQPLAKKQFPLIIKNKTACGVYRITNITTSECYIGQAVDIYKRWCQHAKAGLGIDTPPGNKLYKAMQEYGLENFTFEVLEECDKEELDEKENYFIELYEADIYGYNGRKQGVK